MSIQQVPIEIWHKIADLATCAALVRLTKVNRRFLAMFVTKLYQADILESGGSRSMNHGLEQRLINVIKMSLAAGTSPNVRIYSKKTLDSLCPRTPATLPRLEDSCHAIMHCMRPDPRLQYSRKIDEPASSESATKATENTLQDPDTLFEKSCYWTPLHVAAARNDVELLELLLERGADPNSAGRGVCFCHSLPSRRTIGMYDEPETESYGEYLEIKLVIRWSPLHVAVCKGQLDCAKLLIDRFGLAHATESDEIVMAEARWVLREGPIPSDFPLGDLYENAVSLDGDIVTPDGPLDVGDYIYGSTPRFDPLPPMHIAASKYKSVDDFKMLYDMLQQAGCLEGSPPHSGVDVLDAYGDTPLAVAAFSGRLQVLGSWLRSHGANINFVLPEFNMPVGDEGLPLFFALCQEGLYKDALLLVDMGVDMNANMERNLGTLNTTPLHLCCTPPFQGRNRTEAITLLRRLLDDGADVDFRDRQGRTPLIDAVDQKFTAAVDVLLKAQANVGLVDHHGASALHYAVANVVCTRSPRPEALMIVELLLDYGSDPNQCSEKTGPPLFANQYRCGSSVSKVTSQKSSDFTPPGSEPNGMTLIAPLLVSRGADPNYYDLENPRSFPGGFADEDLEEQFHDLILRRRSLAISAFLEGEFESLDSLVACGTIVTFHDYLLMMRSLVDRRVRLLVPTSRAVGALFRLLDSPAVRLGNMKKIMDAWTQMLQSYEPSVIPGLVPHLALTRADTYGGYGIDVLYVISYWEPNMEESLVQFESRVREAVTHLLGGHAGEVMDRPDNNCPSPLQHAVDHANVPVAKALIWQHFSQPVEKDLLA